MTTATSPNDVNTRLAGHLADTLGTRRYELWFKRSARFAFIGDDNTLRVTVPNRFVADWIERNFGPQLDDAAHAVIGPAVRVDLRIDPEGFEPPSARPGAERSEAPDSPPARPAPALPRHAQPHPALRHKLDDFIVGPSNQLAHAAAARLVEDHHGPSHPVFLHGGCGLGKTHLLQGVCTRMLERNPHARVHYTTGEQFTNDYITAVRTNKLDAFRRRIRSLDLLAVDDVHFIANKQATQQEFLHSFDQIELGGARVILASDCHPKLIKQFSEALISRCVRGLVVQVHRPDAETRLKLVEALAQRRGLRLQPGVAQVLADRCEGSVREIEGMLTKLSALAALGSASSPGLAAPRVGASTPMPIGHALLRRLFDADGFPSSRPRRPVRFATILDTVCTELGVARQQVLGSGRHKHVVLARSMTIHLARQLTSMSYPEIAAAMDRPNHSTIITAAQRVQKQLEEDAPLLLTLGQAAPTPIRPTELVEQLKRATLAAA